MIEASPVKIQLQAKLLSKLELIRRVPLFARLTTMQAELVAERVVMRRFMRGETVVQQGMQANMLFVLLNGQARVLASISRGREVFLAKLGPGDHFGEMSLIDSEPHSASVRIEQTTDLLILGRDDFARCLVQNTSLSYVLMRGLVGRLRCANRQITSLALVDVFGRVAGLLLDAAETVEGVTFVRNKVSRTHVAKTVGASREMVSRVLRELEVQGLISTRDDGSLLIRGALV